MRNQKVKTGTRPARPPAARAAAGPRPIRKKQTGIAGFDEIAGGGIPEGRLTSIIGGPGAGKTVFAMQTLVNRLTANGETGIFVTFEEPIENLRLNMGSFAWPITWTGETGIRFVDARMPVEAIVAGSFDLHALLAGLGELVTETGAVNVVFDGIDMLLSGLHDERMERQELARLDDWIRQSNLTAMITVKSFGISERDQLRSGTLQYITECVVVLESAFAEMTSSRNLRIVKYRGSGFAANPVPVVISSHGVEVVSFKAARLEYPTFTDRVSSGIPRLDALLIGGYLRGSGILVSGSPGTSKTSLSASFAAAACERGESALFVSFDESASQIVSNMRSIGLDLETPIKAGTLRMASLLSRGQSPEEHFVQIRNLIEAHSPTCLVIDPLSSLLRAAYPFTDMISECIVDHAKSRGITIFCTSLLDEVSGEQELSASKISTIADTWMHVSYVAHEGERNRALTIVKSRGTGHSNQVRELVLGHGGVEVVDVYVAEGQVLMGTARAEMEAVSERRRIREQAAYKHAQMGLEHEIAESEAGLASAARRLEFKRQEEAFLTATEGERADGELARVAERLGLRRADDDAEAPHIPVSPRGKGK